MSERWKPPSLEEVQDMAKDIMNSAAAIVECLRAIEEGTEPPEDRAETLTSLGCAVDEVYGTSHDLNIKLIQARILGPEWLVRGTGSDKERRRLMAQMTHYAPSPTRE